MWGGLYLLAAFMLMLASDFLHVLPISKKKLKLPMIMKLNQTDMAHLLTLRIAMNVTLRLKRGQRGNNRMRWTVNILLKIFQKMLMLRGGIRIVVSAFQQTEVHVVICCLKLCGR